MTGQAISIFGDGKQVRDFNYVDDVVSALARSLLHDECFGRVFNLGSQDRFNLLDFVETLARVSPVQYSIIPFPADKKLIDIGDYYGDYSAFAEVTGWQPEINLQEGLTRTLAFYQANRNDYLSP